MVEFFLSIFYFIVFCFIIYKAAFFNDDIIPKHWFYTIFGIKLITGILLTAIYTNYYTDRNTADIFKYFDDSKVMFDALKSNPTDYFKMLFAIDNDNAYFNSHYYKNMLHWVRPYSPNLFSDSHIIIRFNAFVRLFSLGYFQVHNVFMNFISLIGIIFLYKAFKPYLPNKEKAFLYALVLIPSLLFWGSGLLKEGIILLALGLLMYHLFKINKKVTIKSLLWIAISTILIIYTKFYLLVALFIPIGGYLLHKQLKLNIAISYLSSIFLFISLTIITPNINENLDIVSQVANKQKAFSRFIAEVPTSSGFLVPELSDGLSIIKNIPNALMNTLIRPFPWECNSMFVLMSFFENLLIISLIILTIFFRKRMNEEALNIFVFCILFVLGTYILIGLTTPVFGAIVRYKIPVLPFLFVALLCVIDINKIKSKSKFLNKIL